MSIDRYDIDWEQDYYPHPDGRWCFAEEAIEAIATKDAEIARLTAELERERKPWSVTLVADGEHSRCEVIDIGHADRILLVRCEEVDRLTAEVTTLRARCGRLADCLRAYEAWQLRVSQSVYCDGHWPEHEQRRMFFDALKECHAHNDLKERSDCERSEQEPTDGH